MAKPQFPTDHHYMMFGRIVSMHARFETGLHHCLAYLLQINKPLAFIIASPYTGANLRNVIRAIAKIVLSKEKVALDKLISMTGRHKTLDRLRNDIGHCMWKRGKTDDELIAIHIDINDGKAKFRGLVLDADYQTRAYSTEDIRLAANEANSLNHEIIAYVDELDAITKNIDLASLDMDALLGSSSKEPSQPSLETQDSKD